MNDNQANIEFVKGNNVVKGARHMELRMWYTRDEYATGKYELLHMDGKELPADMLTKPGNLTQHIKFTNSIQGLESLPYNYFNDQNAQSNDDPEHN